MRKNIFRDESGATLIYVTILAGVAIGLTGLSLDVSAYYLTRQQAQSAADAAALAAAYQLPNQIFATQAAQTAPVASNDQQFSKNPGAITIAQVNFYQTIPADDDDPITNGTPASPTQTASYVHVVTSQLTQRPFILQALGLGEEVFVAEAVATKGRAICNTTPLAICNPAEAGGNIGAPFNASAYFGKQIVVRAHGGGNTSWAPGNFGYLDAPNAGQGTPALAAMIGGLGGAPQCYGANADTKPGAVVSLRTAFNVRFDMYENPFMGGKKNNANFPPAQNVTKGKVPSNPSCNGFDPAPPGTSQAMPRDANIDLPNNVRFGNGDWDCISHYDANHPVGTPGAGNYPSGCGPLGGNSATRYGTYMHEQQVGIANLKPPAANEDGNAQCHSSGGLPSPTAPANRVNDRRILTFAVMNCLEHNVSGNSDDVPIEVVLSGFMTEIVEASPDDELFLEVVGASSSGGQGQVPVRLNEWVELVR